ncbi:sensor histidine kinase [Cytobacillus sp. Hm23]
MKTLYLRIVLTTSFVMISSSIIAFIVSNGYYQYNLKPYNDAKITNIGKDIVHFFNNNQDVNIDEYLHSIGKLGYQLYLVNNQGVDSFYGGAFRDKELSSDVIKTVLNGEIYHGITEFPSTVFITGFFDNALTNSIGLPIMINDNHYALFIRPNVELQFGEMRIFFAVLIALTSLLSLLFVAISTRYLVKPITKLTDATKKISKGTYNIKLNVKRNDEIGQLASNFTQMVKSIEQLDNMRQEFVSNVSHELQSPLTSIQGFAHTMQTEQLTTERRNQYLSIIEYESRRMSQVTKQLLTLASLDKEEDVLEKTSFNITNQIKQVIKMTEWNWREKNICIEMELPSITIQADKRMLHQVWLNIVTNSIKFTPSGGSITIQVKQVDQNCLIEISDTGIGISEEDLPYIFNRFYKADKSRVRKTSGSGLGLSITKKIIDMHNGEMNIGSTLGEGTKIQISLPLM